MTINATAAWLLALYVAVADEQGATATSAHRHDPERHHQGVPLARHLRVPARAVAAADQGHDPLHRQRHAEVEPDQRVLLSPAGGGSDAGAGAGVRAGHRAGRARRRQGLRRGGARRLRRRWSGASRSSSTPACGSSPRSARCAPSPSCGTRSRPSATACTDAKHRLFRYGVQVNSLGLTEQQPENNVYRILIEMLAVTLSKRCARPRRAAAGLERGARPAAALGPAVVDPHAADPGLRDRPARIRRHLRGLQGHSRARSTS